MDYDIRSVWVLRPVRREDFTPSLSFEQLRGVYVESCEQRKGPDLWAIRSGGNVLGKDGEFCIEPMPSSRTDEFLQEYRWPSLDEAIEFANGVMVRLQT